jgi:hypothetical protein
MGLGTFRLLSRHFARHDVTARAKKLVNWFTQLWQAQGKSMATEGQGGRVIW